LIVSSVYTVYQYHSLRAQIDNLSAAQLEIKGELARSRDQLRSEISRVNEDASAALNETSKNTIDSLRKDVENARRQANALVGESRIAAMKRADAMEANLTKKHEEGVRKLSAVDKALSEMSSDSATTKSRVGEFSKEVGAVKSQLTATKSELDKAIEALNTTMGDLGILSGRIATNSKELAALKARGERNYQEFTLQKERLPKVIIAGVGLRLRSTDLKKGRYSVDVVADDKVVEKKDKTINEPVQFLLSKSSEPYELVINQIAKDRISGYLSTPKNAAGRK